MIVNMAWMRSDWSTGDGIRFQEAIMLSNVHILPV